MRSVDQKDIADREVILYPERISDCLVYIIAAIRQFQVTVFIQQPVTDIQPSGRAMNNIVSASRPYLESFVDLKRITFIEIGKSPIIKVRQGFIQIKIKRRCQIIIDNL